MICVSIISFLVMAVFDVCLIDDLISYCLTSPMAVHVAKHLPMLSQEASPVSKIGIYKSSSSLGRFLACHTGVLSFDVYLLMSHICKVVSFDITLSR